MYSEYLDTIFPDSKVKDIVYHGVLKGKESYNKILTEGFRTTGVPKFQTGISENENSGIYFSTDFALASNYGTEHIDIQDDGTGKRGMTVNHYIIPAIVNIKKSIFWIWRTFKRYFKNQKKWPKYWWCTRYWTWYSL